MDSDGINPFVSSRIAREGRLRLPMSPDHQADSYEPVHVASQVTVGSTESAARLGIMVSTLHPRHGNPGGTRRPPGTAPPHPDHPRG